MPRVIHAETATAHLAAADPVMARLVGEIGPFTMREGGTNPYQALCRSIVFQQLSGRAAATIYSRFVQLFVGEAVNVERDWYLHPHAFPEPAQVLTAGDEELRGAGLSRQKVAAVRSLSEHFASGALGNEAFTALEDDAVLERLTAVRGVGRWTAEMFLMFHLRRADVLPVNDVGINRAIAKLYGLGAPPKPAEVLAIGAAWRPHASVACWYLWRSEDVKPPEV